MLLLPLPMAVLVVMMVPNGQTCVWHGTVHGARDAGWWRMAVWSGGLTIGFMKHTTGPSPRARRARIVESCAGLDRASDGYAGVPIH